MGRTAWRRRKTMMLIVAAVLAGGVGVLAYATNLLRRSELQTIDARFSIRGTQTPSSNVAMVGIDPITFQELTNHRMHSEFPFPRHYDAEVIDHLRVAGAKTIAMDMEFTHPTDESDDDALFEAIGQAHGKVVLGTTEVGEGGSTLILGGNEHLHEVDAQPAEVRLPEDSDGVIRRFAYSYEGLGSFAVVTVETTTGHRVPASLFKGGTMPIDFAGPPGTVNEISYWSVLRNSFSPSAVRGKIVIVGATSPVLQ